MQSVQRNTQRGCSVMTKTSGEVLSGNSETNSDAIRASEGSHPPPLIKNRDPRFRGGAGGVVFSPLYPNFKYPKLSSSLSLFILIYLKLYIYGGYGCLMCYIPYVIGGVKRSMRINSDKGLGTVARMYEKNSALGSVSKAADWFADVEKIDELKKALIMAIDCGNFDKALFILKQLQALKA